MKYVRRRMYVWWAPIRISIEAALACARLGLKTVIFTVSVDSIALMPCNPNIGGTSKGHLVRELDALGGEMEKI